MICLKQFIRHIFSFLLFFLFTFSLSLIFTSKSLAADLNVTGSTTISANITYDNATVSSTGRLYINGGVTLTINGTLLVQNGGIVYAQAVNNTAQVEGEWIGTGITIVSNNITIDSGGLIDGTGLGYAYGKGPAPHVGATPVSWTRTAGKGLEYIWGGYGGASYGGLGSSGGTCTGGPSVPSVGVPTVTYGSATSPIDLGSGGYVVAGGSAIKLEVLNNLVVNGNIKVDGLTASLATGPRTSASGGSIWISTKNFSGSGLISANGGNALAGHVNPTYWTGYTSYDAYGAGGAGGGGRIAIYYVNSTFSNPSTRITANGGNAAGGGSAGPYSCVGTSAGSVGSKVYEYASMGNAIINLNSNLSAYKSSDWTTNVGTVVQTGVNNIGITKGSAKVASFDVDFAEGRNWANIIADTDSTKSVFGYSGGNYINIPGRNSSTYTLYVPRTLLGMRVGFCPDATTLAGVFLQCSNLTYIDSGTSEVIGSDTVSVDVGTNAYSGYWVITGLSVGMGAFNSEGYVVGGAPEDISIITEIFGVPTDVTTNGVTGLNTVELKSISTTNIIAELDIDFTTDVNLNAITAGSDTNSAFFHSTVPISTLTNGGSSSYTLYIPKGAGNIVRICPGADSLEEIGAFCVGGYDLTAASPNVTIETIDSVEYWVVSGLTGTGGKSLLTGAKDTLTRLQVGELSNHYLEFITNEGLLLSTDLIFITFPMEFDFGSVDYTDIDLLSMGTQLNIGNNPGTDTWGVSVYALSNTIVLSAPSDGTGYIPAASIIKVNIGTNAVHQATGVNQITNPLAIGTYKVDLLILNDVGQETAELSIPLLDSDTVDISGYVTAYIHFDIDTNTDNTDCTYNVCLAHGGLGSGTPGNYTVDLGELTSAIVNKSQTSSVHADGIPGTINSIYFDLTSNAPGGVVVSVKSLNSGLKGPGTNMINSVTDGLDIAANSGLYGFNLTTGTTMKHGEIFANTFCDTETEYCGPTSTPKTVFDTNNLPIDSARVRMDLAAAAAYTNNPGVYTDTLTFTVVATY
jgi:hypothetical protein